MVCRRLRQLRDDGCNAELVRYGVLPNAVTARRCKPARAAICLSIVGHDQKVNALLFQGTLLALAGFRCRCQNNGVSLAGLGGTCTCGVAIAAEDGSWGRSLRQRCIECSGKYEPVFGRIAGRGFRMGWVAESATRNIALKRDADSPTRLNRKAHPILRRQNGTRFPRDRIAAAESKQQPRYSPSTSATSSSWVSTT